MSVWASVVGTEAAMAGVEMNLCSGLGYEYSGSADADISVGSHWILVAGPATSVMNFSCALPETTVRGPFAAEVYSLNIAPDSFEGVRPSVRFDLDLSVEVTW